MSEGQGAADVPRAPGARPGARTASPGWLAVLAVAVLVQLVVLYAPSGPGGALFPNADKVVHVGLFLLPVAAALFAGLGLPLVVAVFAAHAVVSEVVQGWVLPTRSGDGWDVVADLVGVALGVAVWLVVRRRHPAPSVVAGHHPARW